MKQTSVEWLQAEFNKWAEGRVFIPQDLLEEAKRLEKEQIINAHTNAYLIGEDNISVEDANKASEQYYNQTYNK